VQERTRYDAFGRITWLDAAFAVKANSDFNWNRAFTGQVLDSETGLMLYRNRFYNTGLGRFVQRDPIGYQGKDVSLYRYVRNNSLRFNDSLGLQEGTDCLEEEKDKTIAIAVGVDIGIGDKNPDESRASFNRARNVANIPDGRSPGRLVSCGVQAGLHGVEAAFRARNASVWVKLDLFDCKCRLVWSSWLSVSWEWRWVRRRRSEWERCDLASAGYQGVRGDNVLDNASDLTETIKEQCRKQAVDRRTTAK
jgi:RHS repeat-associated protein